MRVRGAAGQLGDFEAVVLGVDARDGPLTRTLAASGTLVPGIYRVELDIRVVTRLRQPQDFTIALAGTAKAENVLLVLTPVGGGASLRVLEAGER